MEDILVCKDSKGGTAILTTASPASHYGIPVLRIDAEDVSGDFGPSDLLGNLDEPSKMFHAAGMVAGWAGQPGRTPEEIEAARKYLAQWPEGPQLPPPHIRKQIRLTPDQDRKIRLLAAERNVDQSEIIREAIDQYLKAGK
jgi:hypothetical protein